MCWRHLILNVIFILRVLLNVKLSLTPFLDNSNTGNLLRGGKQTRMSLSVLTLLFICRYNVSCSQHYKSSRGRTAAGLAPNPAPTESTARRRGSTRRSSSNITSNKISTKHLPVKVTPVGFKGCLVCFLLLTVLKTKQKSRPLCLKTNIHSCFWKSFFLFCPAT